MLQVVRCTTSRMASVQSLADHDVVLVMPYIDTEAAERAADVLRRRALADGVLVLAQDDLRQGFIRTTNTVFSLTRSAYFGYLAQDAYPGDGWLRCGLSVLDASGGGLLAFNDGRFFGTIAVFGLTRRSFAHEVYGGPLFWPGYVRHFADTELSCIALARNALVFSPACLLVEVDYEKHAKPTDPSDDALYRKRAATGFDGRMEPFEPV